MNTLVLSTGGTWAKRWFLGLIALLWLAGVQWAGAQTAADGFNPNVNGAVYASVAQSDGRLVIGGIFAQVSGSTCTRLARMNPDGTLDGAFNSNASADNAVTALAVQSTDGKIVVGGSFANLDGTARAYLGRLNADGTLDTAFTTQANGPVYAIAVQADGKILVGGNFTTVGGVSCQGMARLNIDGSVDGTFSGSVTGIVYDLWVPTTSSTDSSILVGGSFSALGGQAHVNIGRLNSNGSPDATFTPSANGPVYSFDRQADGKIMVGGAFSTLAGGSRSNFGRLNGNGTLDTGYVPSVSVSGSVFAVAVEPDGKTVIGGTFSLLSGSCKNLARFTTSGTLDTTLALNMVGAPVRTLTAQPDGKILFGGVFTSVGGVTRNNLARIYSDGTLEVDFNPGANFGVVYSFEVQGDGKILVVGQFTTLASKVHYRIGRLNQNGTSDDTFLPFANAEVDSIALLSSGTMLVGGNFTQLGAPVSGTLARSYIGRLGPDGTVDSSYNPGANGQVLAFAVQADNKVLVGGAFTNLASTACNYIARLSADGTLDTSFTASTNGTVKTFAVQTNGKIIVGGAFTTVSGTGRNGIARLNADGTLDGTFNPASGASTSIESVAVQADGKVLVGGQFAMLGGSNYSCIGRLNADGSLDATFSNSAGADSDVRSIVAQANGQILVGGAFGNLGSLKRSHIGRLNADGTLDTSFVADCCAVSNTDGYVTALALQPDGKILAGGDIGTLTGLTRIFLGRITSGETASQKLTLTRTGSSNSTVSWTSSGATPSVNLVYMDYSTDAGSTFSPIGSGSAARVGTNWQITGFNPPAAQTILLRARATTNGGDYNGSSGVIQTVAQVEIPTTALTGLTLSTGTLTPVFATSTTNYTVTTALGTGTIGNRPSLTITPTSQDPNATILISVNGGASMVVNTGAASGIVPLAVGNNEIDIDVNAWDPLVPSTRYTIDVYMLPSSDATLSNIVLSTGTYSPTFSSGVVAYSATVANAVTSETVTATLSDSTASITSITGTSGFVAGSNTISINTLAQDGSTSKTYTVAVTRLPSSNADLSNLTLSSGILSPTFSSSGTSYTATVPNNVTSEAVAPTLADSTATVTSITGTSGFGVGSNTILVNTLAQDGVTAKTYKVVVTRLPSTIATLSNLTLSSGILSPAFSSGVLTYSSTVSHAVTSETVTPTLSDPTATVTSITGTSGFVVGANTITVNTRAQDGVTTLSYTITVTRLLNPDAHLSNLAMSTGTLSPTFSSGVLVYSATVANAVTSETVTATLVDPSASISSITGTSGFVVGANTIEVRTLATDGTTSLTYNVTVTRLPSANADLSTLALSAGTLSPTFSSAVVAYSATVANSVTSETVTATLSDTTSSITSITGTSALAVGTNTITVNTRAQDGVTTKTYTVTVTRLPSANADLSNLVLSSGTLNPVFASSVVTYSATVANSVTSETVTATLSDTTTTITSITGTSGFVVGANTITVHTLAQDGSTSKTYTVTVTRLPSAIATLSSLALSTGAFSPAFAPGTLVYSTTVANTVTSAGVTATLSDSTASITSITGTSGFAVGPNTIAVHTLAQDGATSLTYMVMVTRLPSAVATLSGLALSTGAYSPTFAPGTLAYSTTVANAVTSLTVTATTTDPMATITGGTGTVGLNVGNNTISVHTLAQDGLTALSYTVTVTRLPSADAYLRSLALSSGTLNPVFSSGGLTYSATVSNVTSLVVTATADEPNATLSGTGAHALGAGPNTISVAVTAQDGTTQLVYTVTVFLQAGSDANLIGLLLSSGTLNPVFSSDFTNYSATVLQDVTTETVTPILSDTNASFQIVGGSPLASGPNTIDVTVTAQDGTTTKVYAVVVEREPMHARYYFETVAGTPGIGGTANGIGVGAQFSSPMGVALSGSGNVYVADAMSCTVRKITPDGTVTTFAGSPGVAGTADGIGSAASFVDPFGIAVDASENVYVTDAGAYTVRKITPTGAVTTIAGTPGVGGTSDGFASAGLFNNPMGIALDSDGNIYVADYGSNTIRKLTPQGIVTTMAGTPGASGTANGVGSAARFAGPAGLAVDANGNVYVADTQNSAIRKVAPDGTVTTVAGMPGTVGIADGTGSAARFHVPAGVAVDSLGNLYVTDFFGNTIREVTQDGTVTTLGGFPGISGTDDGMGSYARFSNPLGLASDGDGTLYIADQANNRISKGIPLQVTGSATVVNGKVAYTGSANPMGLFSPVWFEWGTDTTYGSEDDVQGTSSGMDFVAVTGSAAGLVNNALYHYRLGVVNSDGMFYGADRTFTNGPSCSVNKAVVTGSLVTFSAAVNPNGFAGPRGKTNNVQVYWEYGTVKGKYLSKTLAQPVGTGTTPVAVTGTHGRGGLTPAIYHYRVAMSSTVGLTYGPDQVFSVKTPTATYNLPATTGSGAVVSTAVVANDNETLVCFQYGLTTAYTSGTTSWQEIGNWWLSGVPVGGTFAGLVPNTLYHYRMVTVNSLGTAYGPDQVLATQPRFGTMAVDSIKDAAPGIAGATLKTLGNPAINDTDHLAFQATVSGSVGSGIGALNSSGIWADRGTVMRQLIARTGAAAPGYSGVGTVGTFAILSDPVYANDDSVAFFGTLSTSGTVGALNNKGIWLATGTGQPELIARIGDFAPDSTGTVSAASPVFGSFSQIVLPDHGGAVFVANLVNGVGSATAASSQGIWAQGVNGTLCQVLRAGYGMTVNGHLKAISALKLFLAPANAAGQTRHFNSGGDLLCSINFTDGSGGIARLSFPATAGAPYSATMVVLRKDVATGIPAATFTALGNPTINDSDHVAFQATVAGPAGSGIVSANNSGIWADTGTFGRMLIARTGVPASGYAGSGSSVGTFASLSDPVYANDDAAAFVGTLVKGGAVSGSTCTGIWATVSGSLAMVARAGDPAPDATGVVSPSGPVFASFVQFVLPNQGGVVFVANLVTGRGGVIGSNNQAIWAQDSSGALKQLIRKGDGLTVNGKAKTVSALTIFSAPANATGQTRHFNDAGDLVYKITFTDGSISLVQSVFP